jgi:hypothetical protein
MKIETHRSKFGKGFSSRNFGNMRKFYLLYQERYETIQLKAVFGWVM